MAGALHSPLTKGVAVVSKALIGSLAAVLLIGSAPALAQHDRGRHSRTADEIARGIRDAADAVGTVTEAFYESMNGIRYRGAERYAITRCAPGVERYGRMRVDEVRPYKRRSWRVYGTTGTGYGYDRYPSSRYGAPRAFTCTVRDDGRVKLKMQRLRG